MTVQAGLTIANVAEITGTTAQTLRYEVLQCLRASGTAKEQVNE